MSEHLFVRRHQLQALKTYRFHDFCRIIDKLTNELTLTVMVFFIAFSSVFCFFFFTYAIRSKTFEFKGRPAESVHPFNRVRDATRCYL